MIQAKSALSSPTYSLLKAGGEAELGFRDVKEDLDNDTVQYGSFFTEHENNMDWPDNGDFALDTDLRL